jgi:cytochrome d ubiquinol oxidase subunit II
LGRETGILDWYTILVGLAAFLTLTLHGALWVALKTEEPIQPRARRMASRAWWAVALFTLLITLVTFRVQPHVPARLAKQPWGYLFAALALAGLVLMRWFLAHRDDLRAFLSSCAYLIGMLVSVAFGLYPLVLPASTNPAYSLTVENAKAADYGLRIGLYWWIVGMMLATAYFVYTYRHFAGKVRREDEGGY